MNSYTHSIIWIHILCMNSYIQVNPHHTDNHTHGIVYWSFSFCGSALRQASLRLGKKFEPCGRAFYIDHNTKSTTLERPLPPIEDHCKQNDATDNCIVASVNNLLRLTSDLNSWTPKFVITHGDQSIDVSSAAQGLYLLLPLAYIHTKIFHIPLPNIVLMIIFFGESMLRIYW